MILATDLDRRPFLFRDVIPDALGLFQRDGAPKVVAHDVTQVFQAAHAGLSPDRERRDRGLQLPVIRTARYFRAIQDASRCRSSSFNWNRGASIARRSAGAMSCSTSLSERSYASDLVPSGRTTV